MAAGLERRGEVIDGQLDIFEAAPADRGQEIHFRGDADGDEVKLSTPLHDIHLNSVTDREIMARGCGWDVVLRSHLPLEAGRALLESMEELHSLR